LLIDNQLIDDDAACCYLLLLPPLMSICLMLRLLWIWGLDTVS